MTGSASTPPRSPSRSTATTSPPWARSSTDGSHTSPRLRSGSASTPSRPRASDRAGNASPALTWSFTVADEQAPTIAGQRPLAGSIVPGATVIAFDISDAGTGVAAGTLHVDVDGSDVASWGTLNGGHFSYAPGNLGAGVHTISVTVADNAGNVAGPVMWQFAVADPASLGLAAAGGPASIVVGHAATLAFTATSNGAGMAGARVLVSARPAGSAAFGPARIVTASGSGLAEFSVSPTRTTVYRVELEADPSVQTERTLVVHQRVTLAASRHAMRHGGALQLSGRVLPGRGGRVSIQLLTAAGWRTVARPALNARSAYHATVIAALPGRYVLRAVAAATARDAGRHERDRVCAGALIDGRLGGPAPAGPPTPVGRIHLVGTSALPIATRPPVRAVR